MLFNTYEYIFFFLPITFFIFFALGKHINYHAAKISLLCSSLFFYSWWYPFYLPLILWSVLVNYLLSVQLMKASAYKKQLLIFAIAFNIILLGVFKYTDFFINTINAIFSTQIGLLHLYLPLAISFFTFQQIAYLVDVYDLKAKEYTLLDYGLFVSFFPQLISGPIVRHDEMMPQFQRENININYDNIAAGLFLFAIGFFKKVVIADSLSIWVDAGFNQAAVLKMLEAWLCLLANTLQYYFDFSGYTDMALGAALMFNIRLPTNFNSPLRAVSIQDFWKRWHITLSRFLRNYIYYRLRGNRRMWRANMNIMITFLLSGIWHGASWMLVIWGGCHALALIVHRTWVIYGGKMRDSVGRILTFLFLMLSGAFFRADNLTMAFDMLKQLIFGRFELPFYWQIFLPIHKDYFSLYWANHLNTDNTIFAVMLVLLLIIFRAKNSMELLDKFKCNFASLAYTYFLMVAPLFNIFRVKAFIYFQF